MKKRRLVAVGGHPEIRDVDREAPDWEPMSPEARRYHRLEVWSYYHALPTSDQSRGVQTHPQRDEVLKILRLHTPPL